MPSSPHRSSPSPTGPSMASTPGAGPFRGQSSGGWPATLGHRNTRIAQAAFDPVAHARAASSNPVHRLVGHSEAAERLRRQILRYAEVMSPVMVFGETGVGKDLAARLLHESSSRAEAAFVCLNCAALPGTLVESELFGTVSGAFTGARSRVGLFVQADQGTLFLDEVGELAPGAQAALLRVLETGDVRPVGSSQVLQVDVRVICATHRDLKQAVREGRFRADLYHRLAALRIDIPPLRARLVDVPALIRNLWPDVYARMSPCALRLLSRHDWPGNVRELRNVVLRLQAERPHGRLEGLDVVFDTPVDGVPPLNGLRAQTAAAVQAELVRHGGNIRRTASALGCSRTTVYRHLARLPGG